MIYHSIHKDIISRYSLLVKRNEVIKLDKTAMRRKMRRNAEKRQQREKRDNSIVDGFKASCKENNVPVPGGREKILLAYKQIQSECLKKAMVINSVCTLYALRKLYGFGKTRLYRMAAEFTVRIGDVGQSERSINQMANDLKYDAELDCAPVWEEWTVPECGRNQYETEAIIKTIQQTIPIIMYAVHMSLGFKKRRMSRLYETACFYIKRAVATNDISIYRDELESAGLTVDDNGRYISQGARIADEHDKYMKRTGGYKNAKNGIRNFV